MTRNEPYVYFSVNFTTGVFEKELLMETLLQNGRNKVIFTIVPADAIKKRPISRSQTNSKYNSRL